MRPRPWTLYTTEAAGAVGEIHQLATIKGNEDSRNKNLQMSFMKKRKQKKEQMRPRPWTLYTAVEAAAGAVGKLISWLAIKENVADGAVGKLISWQSKKTLLMADK